MRVYETIISILEENGPMPIPTICHEVNKILDLHREKPLMPSQIKTIVTQKKDLFYMSGERISIHPDKYPCTLIATLDSFGGSSYKIYVNFLKKRFTYFEWRNKENTQPFANFNTGFSGNMDDFKKEIYLIKLWEWESNYRNSEGIILEGKDWYVKLTTKGRSYESTGTNSFPDNWIWFCKTIENLTGAPFR
ncbi:MAG: hypothetical protein AB2392_07930 [Neobacillus sp.]